MRMALKQQGLSLQPQEIEVWYVLPALRREMAATLIAMGNNQKQVSRLLGVTEAAVSQYVHSKRAQKVAFGAKFKHRIEQECQKLAEGRVSAYGALQDLSAQFKHSKELCSLHQALEEVPANCDLCLVNKNAHIA
ncbi:MAG: hypothetical protein Q8P02_00745 [Candidatus Micrarchaeota archaeon]|nr:hypothetical protein [Candidatus Micrarchaeota archaeon]